MKQKPKLEPCYNLNRTIPCTIGNSRRSGGEGFKKETKKNQQTQPVQLPQKSNVELHFADVAMEWCEDHTRYLMQMLTDNMEINAFNIPKDKLLQDPRSHEAICEALIELNLVVKARLTEEGISCIIQE